jgi:hypothetical protein
VNDRPKWLWAVLALVAVGIIVAYFWGGGGDDNSGDPPPGASTEAGAALGVPVEGDRVCDIVPAGDVASAYDVEADALREAFVYETSATTGVSCSIIHGTAALTDVHLYVGEQAVSLWDDEYAPLAATLPPGGDELPEDLGDGLVQDRRRVVVHEPCGPGELLLVLTDPTRQLSADELVSLAEGSLPPSRELARC